MDADLQDPPELALEMIARWREGYEIVYGVRQDRTSEPFLNQALFKLGRPGLRAPEPRLPLLDRLVYELLLPVVRP